jgi:8-oxo-dGTP pyrophosphatase MutT (NUDIX family)
MLFPNAWVFPGGHLEVGENIETGALREVAEEAGIKIDEITQPDGQKHYSYNEQPVEVKPLLAFESSSMFGKKKLNLSAHLIIFFQVKLPFKAS